MRTVRWLDFVLGPLCPLLRPGLPEVKQSGLERVNVKFVPRHKARIRNHDEVVSASTCRFQPTEIAKHSKHPRHSWLAPSHRSSLLPV